VIKASSVNKIGKKALDIMNRHGKIPRKAKGGPLDQYEEDKGVVDELIKTGTIKHKTPSRPEVKFPYTPSGERPLINSWQDLRDALRRKYAGGGKVVPILPMTPKVQIPGSRELTPHERAGIAQQGKNYYSTPYGHNRPINDYKFAQGGSVMKAKIMNMKHKGKVLAAMAKNRAGYQYGGLVGGSANKANERQFDEAGVEMPLKRTSTAPASVPAIEAPQDPSRVKVDPAPYSGSLGRAFTSLMNRVQGRDQELRFKKGGMVKKGIRC
jgi:hypothetical protein